MDVSLEPCSSSSSTGSTNTMNLDWKRLKPCTTTNLHSNRNVDRLTSLPDELLIRILSLLPTKDAAAAACASSKRILSHVFPLITSLDFDDKPISFCSDEPCAIERFPTFVAFVDSVLKVHQSQYLTSFRLGVGSTLGLSKYLQDEDDMCEKGCFPHLNFTQINTWISFSLTHCGLRELDLRVLVREQWDVQLPPEIFTCETLEVLKLEINLGLDRASTLPSFCLPNLKLLCLQSAILPGDGFLARLVSSCPILEDLTVVVRWNLDRLIRISSPSLRRLCWDMWNEFNEEHHTTDSVIIDTPNLECFEYADELASNYRITNMDCLVKAHLFTTSFSWDKVFEVSGRMMLSLMRPLSNVRHLKMAHNYMKDLNYDEVNDQLPVFRNLKCLELDYDGISVWNKVLLGFLNCSPVLETLIFPAGLAPHAYDGRMCNDENHVLERQFCRATLASIPDCCRYHLKRIEIRNFSGSEREIDLVQFLLTHTLVLEKLVIFQYPTTHNPIVDPKRLESTLQSLPRASVTCTIQLV